MQFCPYCNTTNRSGARFCNTCGRPLRGPGLVCSDCRALIAEADKFCHNCGARVAEVGRGFHSPAASPGNEEILSTVSDAIGLTNGTYIDVMEAAEDDPPATATPIIPQRIGESWQFIDSWVAKQTQRDAPVETMAERNADGVPTTQTPGIEGLRRQTPAADHDKRVETSPSSPLHRVPETAAIPARRSRFQISDRQAMGIIAIVLTVAAIVLWLAGGRVGQIS